MMLRQRLLTALVLLALWVPALLASTPLPFHLLVLLLIAAAAWEWARLVAFEGLWAGVFAVLVAGSAILAHGLDWTQVPLNGAASAVSQGWRLFWLAWGVAWVLLGGLALSAGAERWRAWPRAFKLVLGWCVLLFAGLAIVQLRSLGAHLLLSAMALVWVADIAAYFGGRFFGRRGAHKLAPQISPGKTWEGLVCGVLGVWVLAVLWRALEVNWPLLQQAGPSLYSRLAEQGIALGGLGLLLLTLMSAVGDLLESLLKRAAGVKDSSQLLPGHGGVLDRIDALLPAMPWVMLWLSL